MRIKHSLLVFVSITCATAAHAGVTVNNPAIAAVYTTSMTLTWQSTTTVTGYEVDVSTASDFSAIYSSVAISTIAASNANLLGLSPNTTYFAEIGGVSAGTTNYVNTVPASGVTLASPIVGSQIIQVSSTSASVSWVPFGTGSGPNTGVGYALQASTSINFSGTLITSGTTNMSLSTLTVSGLSPSTTYYFQVSAINWSSIPNFIFILSTQTAVAAVLNAPTGLNGTATSPSSILWTWSLVSGATGYHVYQATSPATLVSSVTTNSFTENGLQTNAAYGRLVTAVGSGLESALSSSATTYTLAAVPSTPGINNVGSSSFTVIWGGASNPGTTPYEVSVAQDINFTVSVTTPVPFSANMTALSTSVTGLTPTTAYWVRVRAQNGNGIATSPSGVTATATASVIATGGGGTAVLLPASVPEGGVVTSTLTFTVPSGGMTTGGRILINLPAYWGPTLQTGSSFQDGYVAITSTSSATLLATPVNFSTSSAVMISVQTGPLSAGTLVKVFFQNIHPTCPQPNQPQAGWNVSSVSGVPGTLANIASQPSQMYSAGPVQWLGYNPWTVLTVAANQPSTALVLQANDNCGQAVAVASSTVVNLQAFTTDQVTVDMTAKFASSSATFASPITSITISTGTSSAVYYYETSSVGNSLAIVGTYQLPGFGSNQTIWRSVTSLAALPSFSNLTVDTGAQIVGQKSVTISPDGTGVNNFAYIRFVPSNSTAQWHVAISSNNFQTMVYEQWGSGTPQGNVSWDGRNYSVYYTGTAGNSGPQVVSTGTYTVKVEVPGVVTDTSLAITVSASQISGSVTVGGASVAGAQITAQGTNGPGYSSTFSDASGNFVINGLHAGTSYNLYANYISSTNQSVVTGQINNIQAPSSGQTFTLTKPNMIRVAAVATSTATATIYGNINVHSSDYSQNFGGTLRLLQGTNTTDNGDYFNPSTWTVFYVQPGTYILHLNMQGYGASDVTVNTVFASSSSDVVISLSHEASLFGVLTLPAPAPYSFWASVSGTLAGSNQPTAWGGASFNVGQTTATYSVFDVPAGAYNLVAQINGYAPAVLNNVTVASSDLNRDFPAFNVGGVISGTITIHGDTSNLPNPITLWMNAYSPQLGYNISTQVQLSTNSSQTSVFYQLGGAADGTYQMYAPYLQGFDPSSFGPQSVTVSGGIAPAKDFALTQETGLINASILLPSGKVDYNNVHATVQGPISLDADLPSSPTYYTLSHLGTGFYNITAVYKTSGAQTQATVNLTNGQTASLVLDLSAPTFTVSGTVSVQSGFSMKNSTGTLVTINTISDLLSNATNQNLYIGGSVVGGGGGVAGAGLNCSQVTPISTSTARVEAFPKSFNSFGNTNRTGFTNCFGVGQYNYGVIISTDGSYSIPKLSPGLWEIDVYPYFDNGQTPNAASQQQFVTVTSGDLNGVNFALTGGNSVSGTVSLPTGVTDNRQFNVQILDSKGNSIQSTFLQLGTAASPASSASYQFNNLASGQYSISIQDPGSYDSTLNQNVIKYVSAPVQFKINGADVTGLNVAMGNSARITGSIGIQTVSADGTTPTITLITSSNTVLLPNGFSIFAQADPWIAGGNRSADFSQNGSGPLIDSNNHFIIEGLAPGTYDVSLQQNSYGLSVQAAGGLNLASYTQGSIVVTAGQTVDLGILTLKPGISLSGNVTDTSGTPLSNISVRATPSNSQHGNNSIQTTTDAQGNFTLTGLSSDLRVYDVVAAPRPGSGDSTPPVPYGQVTRLAVDVTKVPLPTLTFTLTSATAQLKGHVITADNGSLSYPDSDQVGFPAAAVFLHLVGDNTEDNPLGQDSSTSLDGSFTIGDLVPGVYDITVESLGYAPYKVLGVTLSKNATQDLGTITLQRGAELDATLARPDGTLVNTGQVDTVVAVSPDLATIIFGQVNKDAATGNILSIKFSGFQLSPQTYNVLLFDKQNNITTPPEGRNLVFTSSSDVITRALTYEQSPPFAFTDAKRAGALGSAVSLNYYFSRPLRNRGDDQDPSQWFTLTNAHGNLSSYVLSGDRRQLAVIYTPSAGEQNATIAFSAHTVDVDPSTGVEFVLAKTITLLLGQKAATESNINPALGGSLSLATSNDPSNVAIPGNALLNSNGTAADATTSYNFTLTATDDIGSVASIKSAAGRYAALASLMSYGSQAYVSEAYQAMQKMSALHTSAQTGAGDTGINPFSSFYSILLPAGISHTLNQSASLTLNYNTNADPSQINMYYFNGSEYLIENANRVVDSVNHTITVSVSHFSTFVVLQNSTPVILVSGDSVSGLSLDAFNFPNPFNLQSKVETLNHGGTSGSLTTTGTVIRYVIPAAKAGAAHIDIYDVVGEKVYSIDLGTPATDTYNYVKWDGKNNSGRDVASGVYIGVLKVGGDKKIWKMAVIK